MLIDFISRMRPFFDTDNDGGGTGGDGNDGGEGNDGNDSGSDTGLPPTAEQSFQRLLDRFGGDAKAAAAHLFDDNWRSRTANRLLRNENSNLKKSMPGNGAIVLKGDEAKTYNAYKQLGPIDKLQTALQERDTLQSEVATRRKDDTLREVAEAGKVKFSVLKHVGGDLTYEIVDETTDGKTEKRVFVRTTNEKNEVSKTPLMEYAQSKWPDFMPALTAEVTSGGSSGAGGKGRLFPRQASQGSSGGSNVSAGQSYVQNKYGSKPANKER
jgi:hypothetical protein